MITFLIRHFKDVQIKTVYEAGLTGFVLHRQLIDAGIDNIVINPVSIEVAANNRVKTDQRDALKMAQQLSAHRLEGIYIPEPEQEAQRCVTRHRNQLVTDRAKCVNRIKSLLTAQGLLSVDLDRAASLHRKSKTLPVTRNSLLLLDHCANNGRNSVSKLLYVTSVLSSKLKHIKLYTRSIPVSRVSACLTLRS